MINKMALFEEVSRHSAQITEIEEILLSKKTKYQKVEIVISPEYGKMLILDGLTQSTTADEHLYHESLVHLAMLTHPNPKKVLVIGGGEGATLREVLKHDVEKAVMVDIDGELVEIAKEYLEEMHKGSFFDERAEIVITDGKKFVEETNEKFDVIVMDVVDPYGSEIAKSLYSVEFFSKIKGILNEGGVVVTQAGNSFFFAEEYERTLKAVKENFPIVSEYAVWVPSFSYACNFIIGSMARDPKRVSKEEIAKRIEKMNLKFYSPEVHHALLNIPVFRASR